MMARRSLGEFGIEIMNPPFPIVAWIEELDECFHVGGERVRDPHRRAQ